MIYRLIAVSVIALSSAVAVAEDTNDKGLGGEVASERAKSGVISDMAQRNGSFVGQITSDYNESNRPQQAQGKGK
jgi:hypothetical protein